MRNPLTWLTRSVFSRLLVILLLAGLGINLLVLGFYAVAMRSLARDAVIQNLLQYAAYLTADLGDPPRLAAARELAQRIPLAIHYRGTAGTWSTSPSLASLAEHGHRAGRVVYADATHRIRARRGRHTISAQVPSGILTFALERRSRSELWDDPHILVLIGLLTLVLAAAFVAIRWVLRPVRWLTEGVRAVNAGNLNPAMPLTRTDELGQLARAFDAMLRRIRGMLRNREQLLLDVSHELRSPVTRMRVTLEFLPPGRSADSLREDLDEMEAMVTGILEEARLRDRGYRLTTAPTDLGELIRKVVADYADEPPGIRYDPPTDRVEVPIDAERIRRVLRNVLENALKYSPADGAPVTVTLAAAGNEARVDVCDRGAGMATEELERIFEPFYRVDRSRSKRTGGYGLGLGLCQAIMDAHGGRIRIESRLNVGTTVTLIFISDPD